MITLDIHGNTASICIDGVWRMVTPEALDRYPWAAKYMSGAVVAEWQTKQMLEDLPDFDANTDKL